MKIGILVTIISGFGKKGYYHSQEIGLGKTLVRMGHEVVVYKGLSRDKEANTEKLGEGLTVHYIPMRSLGIHGNCPADVLDADLDGLLVFADTQIFLPHIYRFCVKNNICFIPYIGIAHSAQRNTKSKIMDVVFSMGTLKIYKQMPVLAKTDDVRDELNTLGVKDCRVTPVGLDENELKADFRTFDRNEIRKKYGYAPEDVIVSFVGRMKTEKRPLDMLDIFASVKDRKRFRLLMVGEGYLKDDILAKIRQLELEEYVQLIDRVPYENMWEIHYLADYFVNLCYREIFGMALMEGIYYESSVAAVEAAGPSFILKGLDGHKLCRNDEEIQKWLLEACPDRTVLQESSKKLIEKFSWNHCADQIIEITEQFRSGKQM